MSNLLPRIPGKSAETGVSGIGGGAGGGGGGGVSQWRIDTENTGGGSTNSVQFRLPTVNGGTYSFQVDWGDSSTDTITAWDDACTTHTYAVGGEYDINITGQFEGLSFYTGTPATGDKNKLLYINTWGDIVFTGQGAFYFAQQLQGLPDDGSVPGFNTTTLHRFLDTTSNLGTLNTTGWDISGVTNTRDAFKIGSGANLTSIPGLEDLDVSSVTDMHGMFQNVTHVDDFSGIENWDVSSVTNMEEMFRLTASGVPTSNLVMNLAAWNTSSLTAMASMFLSFGGNVYVNSLNVDAVTSFSGLFQGASNFNSPVSGWNTTGVTNFGFTFHTSGLNQQLNTWDVSSATTLSAFLYQATSFDQPLDWTLPSGSVFDNFFAVDVNLSPENYDRTLIHWAAQNVANTQTVNFGDSMYHHGKPQEARNTDLIGTNSWTINDGGMIAVPNTEFTIDTTGSGVTNSVQFKFPTVNGGSYNMTVDWGDNTTDVITAWNDACTTHTYASSGAKTITLNSGAQCDGFGFYNAGDERKMRDMNKWGPIKMTTAANAFQDCIAMRVLADDAPNLADVTSLAYMFFDCGGLSSSDWSAWVLSGITNTEGMFQEATMNGSSGLDTWDMSDVTAARFMFSQCAQMDDVVADIADWDVSSITNFRGMFYLTNINGNLNNWNTASLTNTRSTFQSLSGSPSPQIDGWDMSSVTNTFQMFRDGNFNSTVSSWNTASLVNAGSMFRSVTEFDQSVNNFDMADVTNMSYMFYQCTSFDQSLSSWNVGACVTFFNFFGLGSGLSTANYDATLIGWNTSPRQPNETIDFGTSQYSLNSAAEVARNTMINTSNWTFDDGGGV